MTSSSITTGGGRKKKRGTKKKTAGGSGGSNAATGASLVSKALSSSKLSSSSGSPREAIRAANASNATRDTKWARARKYAIRAIIVTAVAILMYLLYKAIRTRDFSGVKETFKGAITKLRSMVSGMGATIKDKMSGFFNAVKATFLKMLNAIRTGAAKAADAVSMPFSAAMSKAKALMGKVLRSGSPVEEIAKAAEIVKEAPVSDAVLREHEFIKSTYT